MTTPIQLLYAASIIANKGLIVIPKLNKNIGREKDEKLLEKENFLKNDIDDDWWEVINESMYKVVNEKK